MISGSWLKHKRGESGGNKEISYCSTLKHDVQGQSTPAFFFSAPS